MTYAADTSVSVAKTRIELEELVKRATGKRFASILEDHQAVVLFELGDRRIMFEMPLPPLRSFETSMGRRKWGQPLKVPAEVARKRWEQACRSRWRALYLTIKAKLISVEAGVETFEEAFLAQVVVPTSDGAQRFATVAAKHISEAYRTGGALLLGSGA